MSQVRVLVGTRKGAFVMTADGNRKSWTVSGPHFGGWEIYHLKGSPADPNRIYASQSSGWFGQLIQRSNDGGQTWEPVGNAFKYDGVPGTQLQVIGLQQLKIRPSFLVQGHNLPVDQCALDGQRRHRLQYLGEFPAKILFVAR